MSVIHFLNVKEGDCTWIQHDSGHNTLIDICNGNDEMPKQYSEGEIKGNFRQKDYPVNPINYLKHYKQTNIFRFILTHPDMDHMDGIKKLFENFNICNFWDTKNKKEMGKESNWGRYKQEDWEFYQSIRKSDKNPKQLNLYAGSKGQYFNLDDKNGNGDGLYILSPTPELIEDANNTGKYNECSYVILYKTNNKKIILAGDSEQKIWDYILENYQKEVENVDLLIAPHHGRKSGGNDEFLDVLKPKLTLFGNANSDDLDYNSWNNRNLKKITNNEANCIIMDIEQNMIKIFVTYEQFARKYNPATYLNAKYEAWYIMSI